MDWLKSAGGIASAISAILALLSLLLIKPLKARAAKRKQEQTEQREFRELVLGKLDAITDDIGDLQYERLSQAHDFYTAQGWCPTSKKQQLCQMYKSYTAKGRNHLSAHYEAEILNLDDRPKERKVHYED